MVNFFLTLRIYVFSKHLVKRKLLRPPLVSQSKVTWKKDPPWLPMILLYFRNLPVWPNGKWFCAYQICCWIELKFSNKNLTTRSIKKILFFAWGRITYLPTTCQEQYGVKTSPSLIPFGGLHNSSHRIHRIWWAIGDRR